MADKAKATDLKTLISTDPNWTIAALLHVYSMQTMDEITERCTTHENGIGFNANDAPILTSIAKFYIRAGMITKPQLGVVQRTIGKYHGQCEGIKPVVAQLGIKKEQKEKGPATKTVVLDGENMIITFSYDATLVARVKTLSGRKWITKKKYWTAPLAIGSVERLLEWGFDLDRKIRKWHKNLTVAKIDGIKEIKGLRGTPMEFQYEGVAFVESRNGRAIIGDKMGLGKTVQAIAFLQYRQEARPALICSPASVKLSWRNHVRDWMKKGTKYIVLTGKPKSKKIAQKILKGAEVIICNYDILINATEWAKDPETGEDLLHKKTGKKYKVEIPYTGWGDYLDEIDLQAVILDECHYIKNPKALRSKTIKRLCKGVLNVIGLSGTPIVNRPVEFHPIISIIQPGLFPSFWHYAQRYCGATHNGFGWDFNGATNTEELHNILTSTIMIRRTKEEVLKDLPPMMRNVVPIEIDREAYEAADKEMKEWASSNDNPAAAMVEIEKLKQAAVNAKLDGAIQWLWDYLESGEKLIVFCEHKNIVKKLQKRFAGMAVTIDGSVHPDKRQDIVDQFQEDPNIKLFIGTKAAKEGITLTAASAVAFIELWWTPGDHDQAEARPDRIGQTADKLNAYYLLAEGTIEDDIAKLLDAKRKILDMVLDGKDTEDISMITELLKKYKEVV